MGNESDQENALNAARAATPFLRRELRPRLASLRYVPELVFVADHSIERGAQLSALIDKVAAADHSHDGP